MDIKKVKSLIVPINIDWVLGGEPTTTTKKIQWKPAALAIFESFDIVSFQILTQTWHHLEGGMKFATKISPLLNCKNN